MEYYCKLQQAVARLAHIWCEFYDVIYHALCAFFFKAKNVMHSLSLGFHIPRVSFIHFSL